ncbi:MAG: ComEC/Rec2 family competence protein [Bacteroidales bacterium]|nr:ComEC/Rec2 family competence protein [Bacteroidales bacterium]
MRRVLLPLAAGIALAEWVCPAIPTLWLILLLAISLLSAGMIYHFGTAKTNTSGARFVFFALIAIFWSTMGLLLHGIHQPQCSLSAGLHTVKVRLNNTPQATEYRYRATAEIEQVLSNDVWAPAYGRLMMYFPKDSTINLLQSGDLLEVSAILKEPPDQQLSPAYNYRTYLRRNGILLRCYTDSRFYKHIPQKPTTLFHHAQRIRQRLYTNLDNKYLTEQHKITAAAMLLGIRDSRLDPIRKQYSKAGIVHLLCVSGLHVGLIALMIGLCLKPLGNQRWRKLLRGLLQLLGVWLYVFITGLSASAVRAGIMFSFFIFSNMFQRKYDPINTLCASAFLMLLFQPLLLFDIGFQLSYAAMTGIVAFHPRLSALVPNTYAGLWNQDEHIGEPQTALLIIQAIAKEFWDLISLTISAQLAVLPLVLYYFQIFPTYFLFAGVLIVPFAGMLLATALAVILLHFWTWASAMAAELLNIMLSVVDGLTLRFGSLPYATLTVPHFTISMTALSYVAIWFLFLFLRSRTTS